MAVGDWYHAPMRLPTIARLASAAAVLAVSGPAVAQNSTLLATVFDERTGESVTSLGAAAFSVKDGEFPLTVISVSAPRDPVDILAVVDSSMVGNAVRPVAEALIEELREDESMAIVAFHDSADLLQDFTSEKRFLREALDRREYGNLPRATDALFAAIDGGFAASGNRKAVVLVSAGIVANGRTSDAEVLELARAKRVAVHSVFMRNDARNRLRRMALRAGGASFAARRLKLDPRQLAKKVLEAVRSPYALTVTGVATLGNRIEATARNPADTKRKLSVSILPFD